MKWGARWVLIGEVFLIGGKKMERLKKLVRALVKRAVVIVTSVALAIAVVVAAKEEVTEGFVLHSNRSDADLRAAEISGWADRYCRNKPPEGSSDYLVGYKESDETDIVVFRFSCSEYRAILSWRVSGVWVGIRARGGT